MTELARRSAAQDPISALATTHRAGAHELSERSRDRWPVRADKVGKPLNITNWTNAVNNLGSFNAPGNGQFASLKTGKYDMDDTFRLVQFDSSIGTTGDYKSLTEIINGAA